jgi:hypothetical protein
VPDEALTATSKALVREREETYFKDRPAFNYQPTGPEPMLGWRRIIQTPSLIAIAYENLTYHLIFMDGRKLEANPERTRMGYSVGRWEGDTLVVDSFGFNDRTWLEGRGLPHTEALRTTERYVRRNVGQLQVELTVTDPGGIRIPVDRSSTEERIDDGGAHRKYKGPGYEAPGHAAIMSAPALNPGGPARVEHWIWRDGLDRVIRDADRGLIESFGVAHEYHLPFRNRRPLVC